MVLGGVAPTPNELRYLEKVSTNKYIVLNKYASKVAVHTRQLPNL